MEFVDQVFLTDVLVIGGGIAASAAALEASDYGADVLVVTKDFAGYGNSRISGGAIAVSCCDPRDNPNMHFRDTVIGGEYLNDQRLVKHLVGEALDSVLWLERKGCIFDRVAGEPDKYLSAYTTPLGGHSYLRFINWSGARGLGLMQTLREALLSSTVRTEDSVMITRLLTSNGAVVGATGVNIRTGDFYVFRSKSTIMATGGIGELFTPHTTNMKFMTGDGLAMAFRAGAELVDMEMTQFMPYAITRPPAWAGKMIGDPVIAGPYGKLLNREGERIMLKYDPVRKEASTRATVTRAIAIEVKEGRGTRFGGCSLDLTENKKYPNGLQHLKRMSEVDPERLNTIKEAYGEAAAEFNEPWDVYPTQHYIMGGVRTNEWCETAVQALYAVGEAQGGIHGANRLGTNSLLGALVFGRRAGWHATRKVSKAEYHAVDQRQVHAEHDRVCGILTREAHGEASFAKLRRSLQRAAWEHIGPIRNGNSLVRFISEVENIKKLTRDATLSSDSTTYNLEWIETLELYNMILIAEIIARSALYRTESRGGHYREDYPNRNDAMWLKNIVARLEAGEISLTTTPTPLSDIRP